MNMLDHKEVLRTLVSSVNGPRGVYVRETPFGYVIHSGKAADGKRMRFWAARIILAAMCVAAVGVWVGPMGIGPAPLAALASVFCVAAGVTSFFVIDSASSGIELHVDMHREELRSAVVTARGESWIRSSARFGEVAEIFLRRPSAEMNIRSLCLRIDGDEETMQVAIGDEKTLLAVHDRLSRDLRPTSATTPVTRIAKLPAKRQRRAVFPELGPDEQG